MDVWPADGLSPHVLPFALTQHPACLLSFPDLLQRIGAIGLDGETGAGTEVAHVEATLLLFLLTPLLCATLQDV